jgi:lipopolysaccharide transport system ATP-binding protein
MLSKVVAPSEGRVRVRGRIGTLLEVGTGFHPELSGRDNVFLSGTILGMSYREVARKFDEIVAFSEVEKFVDTPVKRYSSGMYVRLAFAVAAFLEPDILIVDEVLAVGDAAFQRKSLGRLNEVSERDGRTVLFVSHNLDAIRTFCKRVLVFDKGRLVFDGPTSRGLEFYLRATPKNLNVSESGLRDRLNRTSGAVRFTDVAAANKAGELTWNFEQGETIVLKANYKVVAPVSSLTFQVNLRSALDDKLITSMRKVLTSRPLNPGDSGTVELVLPDIQLRPGDISLYICLGREDDAVFYDVLDANVDLPLLSVDTQSQEKVERQGIVSLPHAINFTQKPAAAG